VAGLAGMGFATATEGPAFVLLLLLSHGILRGMPPGKERGLWTVRWTMVSAILEPA